MTIKARKNYLLLGAAVAALGLTGPAFAAPPQPIYSWTGFYAGGNVGYSWGDVFSNLNAPGFPRPRCFSGDLPSSFPVSLHPSGVIGGGQAGYNWQLNRSVVVGIEADLQASDEKARAFGSFNYSCDLEGFGTCTLGQTREAKIEWFGTVRGRIGYLLTPTTLLYGTGGLAYGRVTLSGTVTDPDNTGETLLFGRSQVNAGFVVGTGFETMIGNSRNWTFKAEYLYIDLGSLRGSGIEPITNNPYSWDARFIDNIFRVGVNYQFH